MGTAQVEGELWGAKARDWAERCEHVSVPLWRTMLEAADVREGTRFLDLGCGSAGSSVLARDRGAKVWGFDASENLLEIARERVPDGKFRQGEIEELPYENEQFDVVFAANSLQFVENKARALSEVKRVKAPGGKFVIGMWCEPERCEMSVVFKALMELAPPPPDASPSLAIRENLVNLITSNGFTIRQEGEVECVFDFESVEQFVSANSSPGIIVGLSRMVGEEAVVSAMRNAAASVADSTGRVRLSNWFRWLACV